MPQPSRSRTRTRPAGWGICWPAASQLRPPRGCSTCSEAVELPTEGREAIRPSPTTSCHREIPAGPSTRWRQQRASACRARDFPEILPKPWREPVPAGGSPRTWRSAWLGTQVSTASTGISSCPSYRCSPRWRGAASGWIWPGWRRSGGSSSRSCGPSRRRPRSWPAAM